ncbi:MAG: galactosyldiacylglycerol synthase [Gemmatimonadetes bacterium]|nr:MAG: galactosyldiacylglycerol synthase [Gemmatimonadota bacterium]
MVSLYNKQTNEFLGQVTDEQFQFLVDHLEEESMIDDDYFINAMTLDMLEDQGGDTDLMEILRTGLGSQDGIEITWTRD